MTRMYESSLQKAHASLLPFVRAAGQQVPDALPARQRAEKKMKMAAVPSRQSQKQPGGTADDKACNEALVDGPIFQVWEGSTAP